MNTSISTKLTALALALVFNTAIMGGMAYLFNAQLQLRTTWPEPVEARRSGRLPCYMSPTRGVGTSSEKWTRTGTTTNLSIANCAIEWWP
jgi:hypothetical protein